MLATRGETIFQGATKSFSTRSVKCVRPLSQPETDTVVSMGCSPSQVEDIFNEGGIDLVIQAHVHDYERTLPIRKDQPSGPNYSRPTSPVYVANGAAGNREHNDHPKGGRSWNPTVAPARGLMPLSAAGR